MKKTVRAVLFDLDDTLWSVNPVLERAEKLLQEWLVTHAPKVAEKNSISDFKKRRKMMMSKESQYRIELQALRYAALVQAFQEVDEDPAGVDRAMSVFNHARSEVMLYSDVIPILTRLKERYAIGSISNGYANLQQIGIAHHFQVSIAAHQLGYAKPDAEIFHVTCEQLKVHPSEAIYIGDDPEMDILGAQKAGLSALWINRTDLQPARAMPDHIQPDGILSTLHDLEELLIL